ncbi:MAG TPA: EAL domain-containing protein [Kineosporiaceae bacterium]|nr:EAL domain-containing protein [Kineosporiaceae bacterium]
MRGRRLAVPVAAGTVAAAFTAVMVFKPGGDLVSLWVCDLGLTVTGLVAAVALGVRAVRSDSAIRLSWALLAAGVLFAALGDLIWSWDELIRHQQTLFPSIADASYLLFPVFTGAGLLTRPARFRTVRGTVRLILDGVLVAGSLFALSWVTALGAVVRAGADSVLALTISLAYPVTDVMVLTITIVVVTRTSVRGQPELVITGAALLCMTLADSFFAGLVSDREYGTGHVLDAGFVAAYLLLAVAAYVAPPAHRQPDRIPPPPGWAMGVPYLLCAGGVGAVASALLTRAQLVPLSTAGILIASLLARQMLTILDNRRLLAEIAEREQLLQHQALHDHLTGLANRALFTDRLDHALTLAPRDRRPLAVLFLDLDDFKLVNDSLGHAVGDALLVRVAERLRGTLRESDTVARLGGDEFAVLVEDSEAPAENAERLAEAFAQPFVFGDHSLQVRASIGLAVVDGGAHRLGAGELLKRADLAMYSAKHRGKGRFVVFTPDLARVTADEFDIRDALAGAISDGTVDVAYQPILRTHDHGLLGFEALARWSLHGTPISPEVFLPVARRLGLIAELDEVVLRKALTQLARWRRLPGCAQLTCAVNADESLLDAGRAVALYTDALRRSGLPSGALVVELPEGHLSDSPDLAATVAELRSVGIAVALDDFGTQGSSLSRLHRIRVDTVKLDRDFLRPGPNAGIDQAWLGGVIDLAHRLGIRVVAEGVETQQQLHMLDSLGCDAVQGFLLGRPLPAGAVTPTAPVAPNSVHGIPGPRG